MSFFCSKSCIAMSLVVIKRMMRDVGSITKINIQFTCISKVVTLERLVTSFVANSIKIIIIEGYKRVRDVR